ncbi:DNA-binding SARP family transcriptional activator/Tfp pilus assembly protein PilF [Saccharothrix ecbatanensis]|uniref:DNA-binding SARP family transcriptional activator/Tfp pilus assembly protein PilF n=1 Tax=Saccharothrix ecbatanensis TaxID=1105145 RepID=A0A7W9HTP3_9PSEU|nr:BTAD domain-containing putative transcriptional regulator [Saccharothrix ecbatanensis]MBB5808006.1 DNA-binding SARP family transcriptional activator/Tfp pilus assembly protein PilF [Saccharothrix ecbatanensis]
MNRLFKGAVRVEFGLLGGIRVSVGGVDLDIGHTRRRSVLSALLLEAGRPVSVERLVDRVWGARPPLRAKETLYGYVSKLRAAGIDIRRSPDGYLLEPERLDLTEFRALVKQARDESDERAAALYDQALGRWRGEALDGLESPWFAQVREALHAERAAVELDRNDVAIRLGDHAALLPDLRQATQSNPLDERLAGQLVLALHLSGRSSEALRHYDALRRQLADELGTDPGKPLQDLYLRVLGQEERRETTAVPRQLPAPQRWFTGREKEIADLTDPSSTVVITAIGGAGGIGKTALALHWAHRHVDDFPDGQLYVNLRGFDPAGEPVTPQTALRGFLEALGVDDPPTDLDAQAALYRSLIADKRVLVVLDNARDTAQVTPLLPGGARCTVLITSRQQLLGLLTSHGARSVTLDVLDEHESLALLTARLGAERVQADVTRELLRLCGGLPLALGIVAARAVTQPDLPLSALTDELKDHRLDALDDLSADLRTVFACSLRVLSPAAAELFGLLGLTSAPDLSLRAITALTGRPDTRKLVRELEAAHLVQQHQVGRYRMHDLVRLYAAEVAPVDADLTGFVGYYAATAHNGDLLIEPHRPPVPAPDGTPAPLADVTAAMDWFDAEYESLLAAQRLAIANAWHAPAWHIAWALTNYHLRRGHVAEDIVVWRTALDAAEALGDRSKQVAAHRFLGLALTDVGRFDEGDHHLRRALELVEDDYGKAGAHRAMAWAMERRGDLSGALEHAEAQLARFRALEIPIRIAEALNDVGYRMARLGDYARAEEHCREALALNEELGHVEGEAATSDSLGHIAHHHGRDADAVEHYRHALKLYRQLDNSYEEASVLRHFGDVLAAVGRADDAREAWQRALTLFRAQGRVQDADDVLELLA